uniref:N-acetyltransferase domain-containing protein n=1 Tax=viral metagenome TaxID=1070528 RepID=A0A6C0LHN7_9ZZZZ
MSNTYKDPLTKMEVDEGNIEKWKNKLKFVSAIPNHILSNMDVKTNNGSIQVKRDLYFDRVKTFIGNKSGHLLNKLITVNKSHRILEERKSEYNDIMRKYNKSIKEYKDKDGKTVVVRLVLNKNKDKMMAYLQYYNYKKHTKDEYDNIISEVQDYILKHQIYGLYVGDLMMGFLVIKKSRVFNIDDTDDMVDTFYIQEVFIDTNMRGKKLGKILIEYALLLCPVNKKYMSLMTYEGNIMAKIATDNGFVLQKKPSVCPVNKLLLIRAMNEDDFNKNTNRITVSDTAT